MEPFEVIDARAVGMIDGGAVKDLILLPANVFNLLWEHLQKRRADARAAKVESLIEKSAVIDLVDLPSALFDQLHERLGHVRVWAQQHRDMGARDEMRKRYQLPLMGEK